MSTRRNGGLPRAEELPEVQALAAEGWRPLHDAPLYRLLPAAWPPGHRTWVPDRLPRVTCVGTTDCCYGTVEPLPDEDDAEGSGRRFRLGASR